MDIDDWMVMYGRIVKEFGFDPDADTESARYLDDMVRGNCDWTPLERTIRDSDVIVAGAALGSEVPTDGTIIAADGATTALLELGIVPDVIVTDLDGNIDDQISCSSKGTIMVVHAHGDNIQALKAWVPRFGGPVCGTTQVRPFGAVRNFGGFTDGDRAVMMADELGASSVRLAGFRFDRLGRHSCHRDPAVKMAKLRWAEKIISSAGVAVEYLPCGDQFIKNPVSGSPRHL